MGNDKWHQFIKEYYEAYKGKFTTFDDLILELSKYLDDKEIKKIHLYLDNNFSYFLSQNSGYFWLILKRKKYSGYWKASINVK